MREIDHFFDRHEEALRSYLLALRQLILDTDEEIREAWKYKLPMYTFRGKNLCYIWKDKNTNQPYVGIVKGNLIDHPLLDQGNRKRMKVLPLDTNEDIPVETLQNILNLAMEFYP